MKSIRRLQWAGLAAAGVLTLATAVTAQDATQNAAQSTTRAARLSSVDGQVQLTQGATVLAAPALANTPLFEGTRIATAEDGRAEIQFDDGSIARVTPNSSLTLSVMHQEDGTPETEVVLDSGLAYFELQGTSSTGRFDIRFGRNNVVTASGFTVLRVDRDAPPGALAVFSGNAHLDGASGLALDLHGGESAALNAAAPGEYQLAEAIEPDSWDAWNSDRDQALTAEEAQRTVATNNVPDANNPAWNDLDANGNWYNVPGQGYVWSPYAAQQAGWDPYGCGNWMWEPGYGYIWVSCEPWGFMPYASGLWSYYDGFGWGWEPGGYGWGGGANIGRTPFHYTPPRRPRPGPVNPHRPEPTVAVNRFHDSGNAPVSVRPRGGPVTIAGTTVQPLRPVGTRTVYNHEPSVNVGGGYRTSFGTPNQGSAPASGFAARGGSEGFNTGARPTYQAPAGAVPGFYGPGSYGARGYAPNSGYAGRAPAPTGGRNSFGATGSAPPSRPSGGGSAPHFSGGGGGGGGSAPHFSGSGGGGGGGGGASHGGGGGGGGGGGAHH